MAFLQRKPRPSSIRCSASSNSPVRLPHRSLSYRACMYVCTYVRMYVCICVQICAYVCLYVCMRVRTYVHLQMLHVYVFLGWLPVALFLQDPTT